MENWGGYLLNVLEDLGQRDSDFLNARELLFCSVLDWSDEQVQNVVGLLKRGEFKAVRSLAPSRSSVPKKFSEELVIFELKVESGQSRWILVYDNDDMWHKPTVAAFV